MFDSWILVYISCYFLLKTSNCCFFSFFHCKIGSIFFSLMDDDEVLVVVYFFTFVELFFKVFFKQNS